MSFPHLPCLLMRLHPSGVRTSAKLQIKLHATIEYAEKHNEYAPTRAISLSGR